MKKSLWIVSPSPFLLTHPTVSHMSIITGLTLLPQLLLLGLEGNIKALTGIALAVAGSIIAELCFIIPGKKNTFGDGTAILTGLLTGFLLPYTLNPLVVFLASFSGIFAARVLFGGSPTYWMNPVATAVCIAYISQSSAFPAFLISADGVQAVGDAFGSLRLDHFRQLTTDQSITGLMNTAFLNFFGIKLPEGYITLIWDSPSVIPAFRYNLLTLASSIVLVAMNIIDWIIPLFFLLTYSLCIWFFSLFPFTQGFSNGDILFALMTSGILFTSFYVLPEYTTTPRTQSGKAITGILSGLFAFLVCGIGGSPSGAVFTVVLVNTVNPVIEFIENRYISSQGIKCEYTNKA